MSQKSRRKSRRDSNYPKTRQPTENGKYAARCDRMITATMKKFDCHVHPRVIQRFGLRPQMVVRIAQKHRDNRTPITHDEALEILRSFQGAFPEMGRVRYEMRE